MNIQKITIITSLILVSNAVYSNEMLEGAHDSHAHHNHHDHSQMEMSNIDDENSVYVCPMHPEIMTEDPSKCPICGMNLERVELEEE